MSDTIFGYTEAFDELYKQANNGNVSAQYRLGLAYASGDGVSVNFDESVYWLRQAASEGYPQAIEKLDSYGV